MDGHQALEQVQGPGGHSEHRHHCVVSSWNVGKLQSHCTVVTCGVRSAQVGCEGGEGEGGGQTGGGAEGGAEREVEAVADHCKEHHGRRSGGGKVVHTT